MLCAIGRCLRNSVLFMLCKSTNKEDVAKFFRQLVRHKLDRRRKGFLVLGK